MPSYFLWLASMSLAHASYMWPVTMVLLAAVIGTLAVRRARPVDAKPVRWGLLLPGLLVPPAILLYGTLMRAGPGWKPQAGAGLAPVVIYGLLLAHIGWIAYAAWRSPGRRAVVASVGACEVWWSLGAAFIAFMSVSGTWL